MKYSNVIFGPFWQDGYITVHLGKIVSVNLKVEQSAEETDRIWNAAIDGLESMLLSMHTAGIDLDTSEMRDSVQTTLDAIANHYGI